MSNIVDYIKWRGDTLMQYSPVNNVDCLIFCTLAYLPFDNVVSSQLLGHSVTISQVCEALLSKSISNELAQPLTSNQAELLSALLYSDRFKNIKLVGFRNIHSQEVQTQFSATTFILPDNTVYVAYRGTDGSLGGSIDYAVDQKINFDIEGNGIIIFDAKTEENVCLGSLEVLV